jgi:hypothetical protein
MKQYVLLLGLLLSLIFVWGCQEDDAPMVPTYEVPTTYDFENVDYSGQTQRLAMLLEMKNYLASANTTGVGLDANRLQAMFENGETADWAGNYDASRQLKDKTQENQAAIFEDLFQQIAVASSSDQPGSEGQAGVVVSTDGTKQYLLDEHGVEIAQLIEKGLMGACFYYQAATVYLGEDRMNADNEDVEPGRGTAMEHHWDEAFGYWGVPTDFPSNTDGLFFWGVYTNRRDPLIDCNQPLMDAFLEGRAAISNDDLTTRDEAIVDIRREWEEVVAATAVNYLNTAMNNFDDMAIRAHALSEGVAFLYSLQFNPEKRITNDQVSSILELMGGSNDYLNQNFYQVNMTDLQTARDQIAAIYGFESIADQL